MQCNAIHLLQKKNTEQIGKQLAIYINTYIYKIHMTCFFD